MTPENETKLRLSILETIVGNREAILRNKVNYPDDKVTQGYNDRMQQEEHRLKQWLKLMDEKPAQ